MDTEDRDREMEEEDRKEQARENRLLGRETITDKKLNQWSKIGGKHTPTSRWED
jgi:hypothetical protein